VGFPLQSHRFSEALHHSASSEAASGPLSVSAMWSPGIGVLRLSPCALVRGSVLFG
jgi:hypothetical protein